MNPFSCSISLFSLVLLLTFNTSVVVAAYAAVIPTPMYNITEILSPFPKFSRFSTLLSTTYVDYDISFLTKPFTILVVPNYNLRTSYSYSSSHPSNNVLRCHVLLKYLTLSDLRAYPASGTLVPTLFKSLGHRDGVFGSVNITHNPTTGIVTIHSTAPTSNATLLSQVSTIPSKKISVLSVDAILTPYGFGLISRNISEILIKKNDYHIMSTLLMASGLEQELENEESKAGFTLFVPPNLAFSDPETEGFKSLTAFKKAAVLKYHVLNTYYSRGSLQQVIDPFHATLETEDLGAGRFTLNITRVNGSVALDTGVVTAFITKTLYDRNPVAIFEVSKVLLPSDIFGDAFFVL